MHHGLARIALLGVLAAMPLAAQGGATPAARPTPGCSSCAEWNAPQRPFRIYGNTYFVGTHGLSAILVTSPRGHVLIDGALPESAPLIRDHIRALGFRMEDVELILNSHAHFDHAGGIAELQRLSHAVVAASPASAAVLERGASGTDDPQYGSLPGFAPVRGVRVIADGETVRAGSVALTARFTPGHTPGGTTWSWRSCERQRCLELVYADSQTPVSADGFSFTSSATYPNAVADFERGFAALEGMRCDLLVTPHPAASGLWDRVAARERGNRDALLDGTACKRYAATARQQLATRLASERAKNGG